MPAPPTSGRRVLVTRARHQVGKLSDDLRAAGLIPVEVPVLEIALPLDFAPLDAALEQLGRFDWLVFTSANTVRAIDARAAALGVALNKAIPADIAAVGAATASAAREAGWHVTFVPEQYVAENLVTALETRGIRGKRFLLARAEIARDTIPDALRGAGATVEVVDAYRNLIPASATDELRDALATGLDAATFTSSSSVNHLRDCAAAAKLPWPFPGVPAVSIGPITSRTLCEAGWKPAAEANPHDVPGLVAAVAAFLGR